MGTRISSTNFCSGRISYLFKIFFVISKRTCPFCHTAKNILNKYDILPEQKLVLEIDGDKDCADIQDYMLQLTGGRTVPRVFIAGTCIGGGNETASAHKSGQLEQKLRAAGAIV